MKHYIVRLMPEAESDLLRIYAYISEKSASREVGRRYVDRITGFLSSFETFPERGTVRSDIREGLRIIGFENRVSVAFIVEHDNVVVLRIAYGGQQIEFGEH